MSSSATGYATGADLLNYHDARSVCSFVADDDVKIAESAVPTNAKVLAALLRASGEVEMAAQTGGKYSPTDLDGLTGAGEQALVGLVCDLAFWHLAKRRRDGLKPDQVSGAEQALKLLEQLRKGDMVFPIDNIGDAGIAHVVSPAVPDDPRFGPYGQTVRGASRLFGRRAREAC